MLVCEHENGLQIYKAQRPLQWELFSTSVNTVSELPEMA